MTIYIIDASHLYIVCEIYDDLPGLLRILNTEAVDARQSIIDKVRPFLHHHDTGALIGDLLLPEGTLYLIGQKKDDL